MLCDFGPHLGQGFGQELPDFSRVTLLLKRGREREIKRERERHMDRTTIDCKNPKVRSDIKQQTSVDSDIVCVPAGLVSLFAYRYRMFPLGE